MASPTSSALPVFEYLERLPDRFFLRDTANIYQCEYAVGCVLRNLHAVAQQYLMRILWLPSGMKILGTQVATWVTNPGLHHEAMASLRSARILYPFEHSEGGDEDEDAFTFNPFFQKTTQALLRAEKGTTPGKIPGPEDIPTKYLDNMSLQQLRLLRSVVFGDAKAPHCVTGTGEDGETSDGSFCVKDTVYKLLYSVGLVDHERAKSGKWQLRKTDAGTAFLLSDCHSNV